MGHQSDHAQKDKGLSQGWGQVSKAQVVMVVTKRNGGSAMWIGGYRPGGEEGMGSHPHPSMRYVGAL